MATAANRQLLTASAKGLIEFINKSPSPWHAVDECKSRLVAAGFRELKETDVWAVEPAHKYFVTRNMSSIVAFTVGGAYKPGNGFSIIGAHTDSPCPRVKPISKVETEGFLQVGIELYGGGNWLSWFDRDLKVAGRVMVKVDGRLENRLLHINRPIMRIPHIAIHLQRDINEKFSPNLEKETVPILATALMQELAGGAPATGGPQGNKHQPLLLQAMADELGVTVSQISDFELCLADHCPATIGGILEEFVFAPRLDNLFNVYAGLQALVNTSKDEYSLAAEPNVRMAAFFDHEEIGSVSAQGADSAFLKHVIERLATDGDRTSFQRAMAQSYLVSADQAHAVHPNYKDKHEDNHRPRIHQGIVVKFNCKQRYATNAYTASILRELAAIAEVPLQDFVVRNDVVCGSTIGPLMSAQLAIPTVDVGGPQLSMHSVREQCCITSPYLAVSLYESVYRNFPKLRESVRID